MRAALLLDATSRPDGSRLFYGKSFIYPLFASPFVALFGTNGFLVFHAVLLALVAWCAFLFLHARMPATVSALLAKVARLGDGLVDLRVERPSLEERFLELVRKEAA
jgi:hypothetical protein